MKIKFTEDFIHEPNMYQNGYGVGTLEILNDDGTLADGSVVWNWREDGVSTVNSITSPYVDPYDFIKDVLEAIGADVTVEVEFKDSEDE